MPAIIPDDIDAPDAPETTEDGEPPVVVVEVNADDPVGAGDAVQLVRTGMVRFRIGDKTWRLRRPFFGELKTLRVAWAEIVDQLGDEAIRAQAVSQQAQADYAAIQSNADTSFEEKADGILELRKRDREVGRRLSDMGDDLRMEWWGQVFEALSVEHPVKTPGEMPAWFASGTLPSKVIQHWRNVPLARG